MVRFSFHQGILADTRPVDSGEWGVGSGKWEVGSGNIKIWCYKFGAFGLNGASKAFAPFTFTLRL